jgi:hypothetical protein
VTRDIFEEALALADAMAERGVVFRLLGGAAIFHHCPQAISNGPYRELGDVDGITTAKHAVGVKEGLKDKGYAPDVRFNALHGDRRQIFHGPSGKLDVFVDQFVMCHKIPLSERLGLEPRTLTVTDLLLTKLQIVELNAKDVQDIGAILREHMLGTGPGDHLDVEYLGSLLGQDWGLWRTSTQNLEKLAQMEPALKVICSGLLQACNAGPKSRSFKLRSRIGDRVRWYELPDEVH